MVGESSGGAAGGLDLGGDGREDISSSQVGLEQWVGLGPILMRRRSPQRDRFRRADQELYIGHTEFEIPMRLGDYTWRSKERSRLETFRWEVAVCSWN